MMQRVQSAQIDRFFQPNVFCIVFHQNAQRTHCNSKVTSVYNIEQQAIETLQQH